MVSRTSWLPDGRRWRQSTCLDAVAREESLAARGASYPGAVPPFRFSIAFLLRAMLLRWVGAGIVRPSLGFRHVRGHADMPRLNAALDHALKHDITERQQKDAWHPQPAKPPLRSREDQQRTGHPLDTHESVMGFDRNR